MPRTKIAELLADERCSQAGPRFSRNHRRREDVRPTGGKRRPATLRGVIQGARGTTRTFQGGRGKARGGGLGVSRSLVIFHLSSTSSVSEHPFFLFLS